MWYVIQVAPGQETSSLQMCEKQLEEQYYQAMFVPRYVVRKKYKGEWRDVCKNLFPGYFFIDTDSVEPVRKALSEVPKLTKLLCSAGSISPITEKEQEYLQSMMDDTYVIRVSTGYVIGDRICITEGALRDKTGWIKKIDRHRRTAQLEIEFFGRMTPVEVGLEVLCKVTEEEFQEMKHRTVQNCDVQLSDPEKSSGEWKFSSGITVKIMSGIFEGMTGEVISKDETKDEFKVSLRLFDRPTDVIFKTNEIERIM